MMYNSINTNLIESMEIRKLVSRAQELTRAGYDLYDRNYKVLLPILKKLLKLTKQEKEWYLYFYTIYDMLELYSHDNNYAEIVKYAEIYYKESALYMERELPNYPNTNMAYLNVWIYGYIFEAYYEYYQIDDAKMDLFMKKYEDAALKYGKAYGYYADEMYLSILYQDTDRAVAAARNFLAYEKEITSCWVCRHEAYLFYLLLVGQDRKAEEMMLDFIHKNIPKKHLWCYQYCRNAEPTAMYRIVLSACVECGKKESFQYFYEKYWKELPLEAWMDSDAGEFQRLLCAFGGHFDNLDESLEQVVDDIDEESQDTTVNNMYAFLEWWCYFILLDRSGVHTVKIALPELETDKDGQVSALALSEYMERKADEYGRKFSQARAQFDYEFAKDSYRKCFFTE